MSLRAKPLKKTRSELDYLKDIRATVKRLETGQKRLEAWANFHKGEHRSAARYAASIASVIATAVMVAVEYFKK